MSATVKVIHAGKVKEMIASKTELQSFSPIPLEKLEYYATNPEANNSDPIAVLAYKDGKLIGNLFLIAFSYTKKEAGQQKAYWLKEWWVHESEKKAPTASLMFFEALKCTGQQIIAGPYSKKAASFYENEKMFRTIMPLTIYGYFFSLDHHILLQKLPFLKPIRPLLALVSGISYALFKALNTSRINRLVKDLKCEEIESIDTETWQFLQPLLPQDWVNKNQDLLNWRLDTAQISFSFPSDKAKIGFTTGPGKNLETITRIKVFKDEAFIGFFALFVSTDRIDLRLKVVRDKAYEDEINAALLAHIFRLKPRPFFSTDVNFQKSIRKYLLLYKHTNPKNIVCLKRMADLESDSKPIRDLDCT